MHLDEADETQQLSSTNLNSRALRPAPPPSVSSEFTDRQSIIAETLRDAQARGQKQDKIPGLGAKEGLSNVHTGLHHLEVAEEYGGCNMVFTFLGEDKQAASSQFLQSNHYMDAHGSSAIGQTKNARSTITY